MNKNITIERVKAAAALQSHRLSNDQAIELIGIAQADQNDELKAQVNELREALEKIRGLSWGYDGDCGSTAIIDNVINKTPEQSLADYRASVIDECIFAGNKILSRTIPFPINSHDDSFNKGINTMIKALGAMK